MMPILQRELIRGARDPAFLLVRWFAAILGTAILFGLIRLLEAAPQQVGLVVFLRFHYLWGAVLLGLGVWLTLPTLVTEREDGTLGLLFMTSLKPFEIVLGKAVGAAIRAGVLWLTAVPISTVPLVLGSVSLVDVLFCTAVDFALLSSGLSVGMLMSAAARTSGTARRAGWGIALAVGALILGGLALVRSLFSGFPPIAADLAGTVYGIAAGLLVALVCILAAGSIMTRRWSELESPPPPVKAGEEPDWIEVEEAQARIAWREGPGRRLRRRWPLGWLRLREAERVETFWIWPVGILGSWAATYASASTIPALVVGWFLGLGFCLQAASGYRQELRSGALELLMTTPVPTRSYFWNRVLLGVREFGLALLLHLGLSVLTLRMWPPLEWMDELHPGRRVPFLPEILLWPLLTAVTGPAVGLLVSARVANVPATMGASAFVGLLLPGLGIAMHGWMHAPRWIVACVLGAYAVQAAWMIWMAFRELGTREFAVMQLKPV